MRRLAGRLGLLTGLLSKDRIWSEFCSENERSSDYCGGGRNNKLMMQRDTIFDRLVKDK
jgi:hypothetical protein